MITSIYITGASITYVLAFILTLKNMKKKVKDKLFTEAQAASFLLFMPIVFGILWPLVWVFSLMLNLVNPEEKKAK